MIMTTLSTQPLPENIKRLSPGSLIATFVLDPQQSFLDQHRPGGNPLFGTVMGIELMSKAALVLSGSTHIVSVNELQNLPSLVFPDSQPRQIHVRASLHAADPNDTRIDCEVFSLGASGELPHFKARFQPGSAYAAAPIIAIPDLSEAEVVTGADVYQLFFHGPVYRVIERIRWTPLVTVATLNTRLPAAYSPPESATVAAPRIIEFALQTAGLMTIAHLGKNRVPHRTARIQRYSATDVYGGQPLLAIATRRAADPNVNDMMVVDLQGRVLQRIEGYHTVQLPFPEDEKKVQGLQQKLLARV